MNKTSHEEQKKGKILKPRTKLQKPTKLIGPEIKG